MDLDKVMHEDQHRLCARTVGLESLMAHLVQHTHTHRCTLESKIPVTQTKRRENEEENERQREEVGI